MPSRLYINDIQAIALMMGGKCLSKEYWDESSLLSWRCENGHNWDAPYKIIRQGAWCTQCVIGEQKQIYLERCQHLALTMGGLCLSTIYIRATANLKWQCANGHKWMATPANTNSKQWCKQCKRDKLNQQQLKKLQAIAKKKGGYCLSESYTTPQIKLQWQCKERHQWQTMSGNIKAGNWCPYCSKKIKHTIEDLQKKAAEHGGKCLSTIYKNAQSKAMWQCARGHKWMAEIGSVLNKGKWCRKCHNATIGDRLRGNLEEYIKIAEAHGGKLLSEKFNGAHDYLKWQCNKGHIWKAKATQVKNKKTWCRKCYLIKVKENHSSTAVSLRRKGISDSRTR